MMTRDEVVQLMKVITRYDNRPPSPDVVDAWYASANIAGWTLPEATEAVVRHFTYSIEYLKPAHVTALIEVQRNPPRDRADSASVQAVLPPAEKPPASDDARAAAKELFTRFPHLAKAGRMPERHPLGPVVGRIQRRAAAEAEALAELDRLIHDTTPDPEGEVR